MVQITKDEVRQLAQLSGLVLNDDEVESMASHLLAIIGYIDQLKELDVGSIEPAYQTTGLSNVTRIDEVQEGVVDYLDLVGLAPSHKDGQMKVPKVL